MKTPSWRRAVESNREFRPERIPVPTGAGVQKAKTRLQRAAAEGIPVDLEIGCGVGLHPILYAKANPGRLLIAIERTTEKFEKFSRRLERHPEITNLVAVHADAVAWATHFAPSGALDRVFILYPNPYPKNPQARWIRMPFFKTLLEKTRPGGEIELRTNLSDYAGEIRRYAPHWGISNIQETSVEQGETHFERKYLERGETCTRIVLSSAV